MAPADDPRSGSRAASPGARVPEGASALADHNLVRRLCQGILLPADVEVLKARQVTEMLFSFYPTMVGVSSASSLSFLLFSLFRLPDVTSMFAVDLHYVRT